METALKQSHAAEQSREGRERVSGRGDAGSSSPPQTPLCGTDSSGCRCVIPQSGARKSPGPFFPPSNPSVASLNGSDHPSSLLWDLVVQVSKCSTDFCKLTRSHPPGDGDGTPHPLQEPGCPAGSLHSRPPDAGVLKAARCWRAAPRAQRCRSSGTPTPRPAPHAGTPVAALPVGSRLYLSSAGGGRRPGGGRTRPPPAPTPAEQALQEAAGAGRRLRRVPRGAPRGLRGGGGRGAAWAVRRLCRQLPAPEVRGSANAHQQPRGASHRVVPGAGDVLVPSPRRRRGQHQPQQHQSPPGAPRQLPPRHGCGQEASLRPGVPRRRQPRARAPPVYTGAGRGTPRLRPGSPRPPRPRGPPPRRPPLLASSCGPEHPLRASPAAPSIDRAAPSILPAASSMPSLLEHPPHIHKHLPYSFQHRSYP